MTKDHIRVGPDCVGDSYTIGFGKFKGSKLADVPASYLMWLIDQDWFINYVNLAKYIIVNKDMLNKEAEEENEHS